MGSRTWVKLYCRDFLDGPLHHEPPQIRGIWATLLALAGNSPYSETGEIKIVDGIGYNDEQLCEILSVDAEVWSTAKEHLGELGLIVLKDRGVIEIASWSMTQSEYLRQKPYRKRKVSLETLKKKKKKQ